MSQYAVVIERIERQDGRLTGDEAWALVITSRDEAVTVVWTDEIAEAAGVAWPILQEGDRVGARMAFLRAYERIARDHRDARRPPQVQVSLGHDRAGRVEAIERAVSAGLLTGNAVVHPYMPADRMADLRRAINEGAKAKNARAQAGMDARRAQIAAEAARKGEMLRQAGMEEDAG